MFQLCALMVSKSNLLYALYSCVFSYMYWLNVPVVCTSY